MAATTDKDLQRAAFQDAVRRPSRRSELPSVEHGPTADRRPDRSVFLLAIDRIRPDSKQVRTHNKDTADAEVCELAESIKAVGIENPLTVRYLREDDIYELIAGERRLKAAKLAGLLEVSVKLVEADEKPVRRLQLHENIHRASLLPLELAAAVLDLLDDGETPDSLAKMLCKSAAYVQKALTVGRKLSAAAKNVIDAHAERFTSLDLLYDVSLSPAEEQKAILLRVKDEHLTRQQIRDITAPLKAKAKAEQGTHRGRKPESRTYTRKIAVGAGVAVTVSFPKMTASDQEVLEALEQAIDALQKDNQPLSDGQ